MLDLPYSLIIEATSEPNFFGFYSAELEGFSGVGHSVEDCLYQAKWGMKEHIQVLIEQKLPVPQVNLNPTVMIQNELPVRSRGRSKVGQGKASGKGKSKVGKR